MSEPFGIKLSPRELRGMIDRGGRADAGFAAVGAPPALIDALSDLFVIPHGRTRSIASEFVAGHITSALNRFWRQVQKETLPSLNIETALMGTSLLEPLARKLLGEKYGIALDKCQPYHAKDCRVSFFCTTSDLHRRRSLLLGRDFLKTGDFLNGGSYDFVGATLSSAAFPTVFAPRCEAELFLAGARATCCSPTEGCSITCRSSPRSKFSAKYRPSSAQNTGRDSPSTSRVGKLWNS